MSPWQRIAGFLTALMFINVTMVAADEIVITLPLRDGRFYQRNALLNECNQKLAARYQVNGSQDEEIELRSVERAALLLANDLGWLKASINADALTLSIPDREQDRNRKRVRSRLRKLFNLPLEDWPAGYGLHRPNVFAPSRRSVLLIHGLEANTKSLRPFQMAFEAHQVQVLTFVYPNDGPIAWSGDQLSKEFKQLEQQHPSLRLVVIAHSMGGLVARSALERPDSANLVTDLFLLGTPNKGSQLARCQGWLEFFQEVVPKPFSPIETLVDGLNEAADDLAPGSAFLRGLNAKQRPEKIRYYTIAGTNSILTNDQKTRITSEWTRILRERGASTRLNDDLKVFLTAQELVDGSGDGAVTVKSASLQGVASSVTFPINHLELFGTMPRPHDSPVFRWILRQLQWQ